MSRTTLVFHRAAAFYLAPRQQSFASFQAFSTKKSSAAPKKRKQTDGPPLIIPPGTAFPSPASLPHVKSDRSHSQSDKEFSLKKIYTINASPLLDSKQYCIASASFEGASKNGTQAARRLNRGKKKLVNDLQTNLQQYNAKRNSSKRTKKNRPFAMIGHGVPKQLLQNHIDMADFLLQHYGNASSIFWKQSHGNFAIEKLRVNGEEGPSVQEWTFDVDSTVQHEMSLYLTTMNRITTSLCQLLWIPDEETIMALEEDEDDSDDDDDFSPPHVVSSTLVPEYSKVELIRGQDEKQQDEITSSLLPIVEFQSDHLQPKRQKEQQATAAGHIWIRLSGNGANNKHESTTLVFQASFQNLLQQE